MSPYNLRYEIPSFWLKSKHIEFTIVWNKFSIIWIWSLCIILVVFFKNSRNIWSSGKWINCFQKKKLKSIKNKFRIDNLWTKSKFMFSINNGIELTTNDSIFFETFLWKPSCHSLIKIKVELFNKIINVVNFCIIIQIANDSN